MNLSKHHIISSFVIVFAVLVAASCKKSEGEGGKSTITGKVMVRDFEESKDVTFYEESFYAPDIDVFLIYGDDGIYADDFKTSFDGSYRFRYLRPGNYTVYALSKDSLNIKRDKLTPVMKTIRIENNGEIVTVEDIVIVR